MGSAIDRLAEELLKLSNDEWSRINARWRAGQPWDEVFGPAWDEISERVSHIDINELTAFLADTQGEGNNAVVPEMAAPPQQGDAR